MAWAIVPAAILPGISLTLMLAGGRGTSEGLGSSAVPAVIVLVALPFLWYVTYAVLHTVNSYVALVDGAVLVRNWARRLTVIEGPGFLVRTPIDSSGIAGEVLIVGDDHAAVMLNPRQWREAELNRVWRNAALQQQQPRDLPTPRELRRRYPTIRIPLYIRHPGIVYTFWTLLVILYIGLVVNVFARI
ncbi:hypothetical protein J7E88_29635 [Streptomyces sp. ISL-10]|uniref:hypothetical protein n=1 Tax=Streptomyces sp. ISL-10 TaxID=2819172 RepID=UPI001BED1F13|nr:hypothetical protein [Streptomyces sp. ISL-10]MBT2369349.1 hypothetical protein [Streptomyces sp. ISL-10]